MALTALERLDLLDELDSLLERAKTAKGLDLLDIGDQIDAALVKLGYGPADDSGGILPTDKPADLVPEDQPKPADVAPEIVSKFLAGEFVTQSDDDFIATITELDQYVGVFLTLDDVKAGAITWINKRPTLAA